MDRRIFIKTAISGASVLCTYSIYSFFRGGLAVGGQNLGGSIEGDLVTPEEIYKNRKKVLEKSIYNFSDESEVSASELTSFRDITSYNNFYEFSTDKEAVAAAAAKWNISDWQLEIEGLVENPIKFSLADLRAIQAEQRIYRFRCVEGWSMVIPWMGFPLAHLLEKAKPMPSAKYVAFESYFDDKEMPSAKYAGISFPYIEGLRLDEALHPLTLMATGLYNRFLPQQNGAPIRLVVPWKYGFKSIKSVSKIRLVESQPQTTWSLANPNEYGFYSNVNPHVDHPRWSQKNERRVGEFKLRETQIFNGYEKQVGHLYKDMDLKRYF